MNILYFYPEHRGDFMFQWQRVHFIDELSRSGVNVDILNPLDYDSLEIAHDVLLKHAKTYKYDLFLTSASMFVTTEVLALLKQLGLPTLCFRPDNLLIPYIDEDIASSFDLIWLTSQETARLYKKWGANYLFAPYAANPYTFRPHHKELIRKVCFVGTPYGSRTNLINTIVNGNVDIDVYCRPNTVLKSTHFTPKYPEPRHSYLRTLTDYLRFKEGRKVLYANLRNRFNHHELQEGNSNISLLPKVSFEQLNDLYSNYALSLSSTSAQNTDIFKKPVKVVNLRAFEIPMSGGLQICRYNQELSSYFEEDKEIVFYNSKDELLDKMKFYTTRASEETLLKMKTEARKKAENEHTWMKRFNLMLNELGLENI